jgi:hypothetical protein
MIFNIAVGSGADDDGNSDSGIVRINEEQAGKTSSPSSASSASSGRKDSPSSKALATPWPPPKCPPNTCKTFSRDQVPPDRLGSEQDTEEVPSASPAPDRREAPAPETEAAPSASPTPLASEVPTYWLGNIGFGAAASTTISGMLISATIPTLYADSGECGQ